MSFARDIATLTSRDLAALVFLRWLLGDPVRAGIRGEYLMVDWTHAALEGDYSLLGAGSTITVSVRMAT